MRRRRQQQQISVKLLLLLSITCSLKLSLAFYICSPRSNDDWKALTKLVADTFDAPKENATAMEKAKWNLLGKTLIEMDVYRHMVGNARKMRGMKYSILIAKEWGKVVGVAEIGLKGHADNSNNSSNNIVIRRPTIGTLCVSSGHRRQGIGRALVQKCEDVVKNMWNDECIYAEVAIENTESYMLFQSCGFNIECPDPVSVEVRQRGSSFQAPHYLLSKKLCFDSSDDIEKITETSNKA